MKRREKGREGREEDLQDALQCAVHDTHMKQCNTKSVRESSRDILSLSVSVQRIKVPL